VRVTYFGLNIYNLVKQRLINYEKVLRRYKIFVFVLMRLSRVTIKPLILLHMLLKCTSHEKLLWKSDLDLLQSLRKDCNKVRCVRYPLDIFCFQTKTKHT